MLTRALGRGGEDRKKQDGSKGSREGCRQGDKRGFGMLFFDAFAEACMPHAWSSWCERRFSCGHAQDGPIRERRVGFSGCGHAKLRLGGPAFRRLCEDTVIKRGCVANVSLVPEAVSASCLCGSVAHRTSAMVRSGAQQAGMAALLT
ncbi:hypothetical protein ERJ75_000583800 [Trypanosoma vivax]|nr:hypothetical protein ERJ75_000583800 [Trypanosoma vivax]